MRTRGFAPSTRTVVSALLAIALGGGGALAGGSAAALPTAPSAPVVGEITALSGTKKLTVTPAKGSRHAARKGDILHLGDVLDPGTGVRATITLTIPKGVSAEAELIFVHPTDGEEHSVRLTRTGKRESRLTIGGPS